MNVRPRATLATFAVVAAGLTPLLFTTEAAAQQADGARFRGGVELELGTDLAIATGGDGGGVIALGSLLLRGQLGAQINHNWGVYGVPTLGAVFGHGGGPAIGVGAMADYTFDNLPISVAAGPEAGAFFFVGTSGSLACVQGVCEPTASSVGAVGYYGIVLRATYYPILVRGDNGIRRKALAVGLDLHLDGGGAGVESINQSTATASAGNVFLFSPAVFIGYQAF